MTRQEVLQTPAYWEQKAQLEIYQQAVDFMQKRGMNRSQFAQYLGVSKSYVTQLLSGDYNYSLEKLVDLSMKLGFALNLEFRPISQVIFSDTTKLIVEDLTRPVSNNKQYNFTFKKLAA